MKLILLLFILSIQTAMFSQNTGSVQFLPLFDGKPVVIESRYDMGDSHWVEFSELRFYVSDLIVYTKGKPLKVAEKFHLMDLEDSSSFYIDNLPKEMDSLVFNLGIDSVTNVAGILEGDLDPIKGMYWAWNSGYINFKLEGSSSLITSNPTKSFEFHLGGYLQLFPTIRRVNCAVEKLDGKFLVPFDLGIFLNALNLNENNSIMIPGKEASELSLILPFMFEPSENE